ncbi:MAG: hypothetical protein ACT4PV_03190 [Planctomycetaceae bacterium]
MGTNGKRCARLLLAAGCLAAGLAFGRDEPTEEQKAKDAAAAAKLALVRREVKQLDFDATLARLPAFIAREQEYMALVERIKEAASGDGADLTELLGRAREMKLRALPELNEILVCHRGPNAGLEEAEVRRRLDAAVFTAVRYEEEWLVNILDDLETNASINIELDARVYKFDVVSFRFERTSASAMLQTMADNLQFKWVIRGDTLYVYREMNEILFDDEWLAQKRAVWQAKQDAKRAAEAAALEREKPQ